ncbi:bifunctional protein-disulfide isomerase/oxidoreductase DsbC [Mannheimia varigena]|uniref:bifunctional protein-disulfide isomerase/oxidoreductase DsbC n=1 Tax=Mannheimia varigena TaxID=85404 RepID=UPI000DBF37B6|nr:bifunctional protein-disulfide isomerase/oxidoreductase DsbC [Mannheimia varigena]AWW34808.1 bifunctional protein-disulfide isomerase/oxidoreductase DsbC [Mannheimia varigena]
MKKNVITLGLMFVSTIVAASDVKLKNQLENMGATDVTISDSPLSGFKMATSNEGIVYISQDGQYVIQGKIFELKNGKAIDITNQGLMAELNSYANEMILYPAKNEKHVVTVFMDITCHYCHLLHQKIKEYNDLGITIRYLAFPRGGMNTQTAKQMEAIWTAQDKIKALNDAENGKLPTQLKMPEIVKKHYQLGVKFGVTGTPNIVTSEGELIGGYVEPKELAKILAE